MMHRLSGCLVLVVSKLRRKLSRSRLTDHVLQLDGAADEIIKFDLSTGVGKAQHHGSESLGTYPVACKRFKTIPLKVLIFPFLKENSYKKNFKKLIQPEKSTTFIWALNTNNNIKQ